QAAFESIAAAQVVQRLPPPPASLAELPVVEVEATPGAAQPSSSDAFAVLLSGDGGWAGIDKQVAGLLADRGVPTAGRPSLRRFWTPRTPAGLGQGLGRIVRDYAFHWQRRARGAGGHSQGGAGLP